MRNSKLLVPGYQDVTFRLLGLFIRKKRFVLNHLLYPGVLKISLGTPRPRFSDSSWSIFVYTIMGDFEITT